MNSEKFVIKEIPNCISTEKNYTNTNTGFVGNLEDAKLYASKHNYSGVEVMIKKNGIINFVAVS